MTIYLRPGVFVEESLLQVNPRNFPPGSGAAFVGVCNRGPIATVNSVITGVPTYVSSWANFQQLFDGFQVNGTNQQLAHAVYSFFNNGGGAAWIVRVPGTGIASATRTLLNRAGTPASVLTVNAANGGAWGNLIYIEITDSVVSSGRFNLLVRYGGTGDQYVVERWTDLAMDPTDGRYAPNIINSTIGGSNYISVLDTNSGSFSALVKIPALSATPGGDVLASGADGSAPTTGATGPYYTAFTQLASVPAFLSINVPEITDSATINAFIASVESSGTGFLVVDCAANRTPAQAISDASSYTASSYAAVYYPRLVIADPSNNAANSTRIIAPGGAVLGQYATTDALRGVFKAPAGITARLNGVVGLESVALDTDRDSLNLAGVNAIRPIPGAGYCIFGARTRKLNQVDRYVNVRRNLISIRLGLANATRFAVFEHNDELLWGMLSATAEQILTQLWQSGGLRGGSPSEAFFVICNASTNTPTTIANGEVHMTVGVALESPAEFVVLSIGQFDGGTTVREVV